MNVFIEVKSINTGNETRDEDLLTSDGWFQEKLHPWITFTTKNTEVQPNGDIHLLGDFSMNGISKEIVIPFEKPTPISRDWAENEQVDYAATIKINRKDFEVFGGDFWDTVMENGITQLSDEVEIELDIHSRRPDYGARYKTLETDNVRKIVLDAFKEEGKEAGMSKIATFHSEAPEKLTSGALNTIGNTLLEWKMFPEAIAVFEEGQLRYPEKTTYPNALGICNLLNNEEGKAKAYFQKSIQLDSVNSRAHLYLQFLE